MMLVGCFRGLRSEISRQVWRILHDIFWGFDRREEGRAIEPGGRAVCSETRLGSVSWLSRRWAVMGWPFRNRAVSAGGREKVTGGALWPRTSGKRPVREAGSHAASAAESMPHPSGIAHEGLDGKSTLSNSSTSSLAN